MKQRGILQFILMILIVSSFSGFAVAQYQQIEDFLVLTDTIGVRADQRERDMHVDVGELHIQYAGFYRIHANVLYNDGDEQNNESYFMTVESANRFVSTGVDTNLGPYVVIVDNPGPRHTIWRDSGLFYFQRGINTIKLHHYSAIIEEYPQLLNGPINGPESVKFVDSLRIIAEPTTDGALKLKLNAPRTEYFYGADNLLAYPGEIVDYRIAIKNIFINCMRSGQVMGHFSKPLNGSNFSLAPETQSSTEIRWQLPTIEPQDSVVITFEANLIGEWEDGLNQVLNYFQLTVPHDIDSTNNTDESCIYVHSDSNNKQPFSADLSITAQAVTDSLYIEKTDSINVAMIGDTICYNVNVSNYGPDFARDVGIKNVLPPFFKIEKFDLTPSKIENDTLVWKFDLIEPDSVLKIKFRGKVLKAVPESDSLLISEANIVASNDTTDYNNRSSIAVLIGRPKSKLPFIEVTPSIADVSDSLDVRVMVPFTPTFWDLWIYHPDDQLDKAFADEFISSHPNLTPDTWYTLNEKYFHGFLKSKNPEDRVTFEIRVVYADGGYSSAQDVAIIHSSNMMQLDRNVFQPNIEKNLDIQFKFKNSCQAQLDIYDISGRHIVKLAESDYHGGWNNYQWDGLTAEGKMIGSGVYIVTLRSAGYNSWKKFIIIR